MKNFNYSKRTLLQRIIFFKKNYWLIFFLLFIPACFYFLKKELHLFRKQLFSYRHFLEAVYAIPKERISDLPREFNRIPFAEKMGIVIDTKKVTIRGVENPYNASIIENDSGYLIFFRFDEINEEAYKSTTSYIGCAELDENFEQTKKEFKIIDTTSQYSEDPRILKVGDKYFLIYNDLIADRDNSRIMRMGCFNLKSYTLEYILDLDLQLKHIEKNWSPFEYIDEFQQPIVHFEYELNPHLILKLTNIKNSLLHLVKAADDRRPHLRYWPMIWGNMRGGSTARKIGEMYLSFFHSSFKDENGIIWYCMGAYTFEATPPFRIMGVSHYPILFNGIYDSPPMNTADPLKRVIFPCSFVMEKRGDKELLHVCCGENDSAIKIITFDKDALMKSLKRIYKDKRCFNQIKNPG